MNKNNQPAHDANMSLTYHTYSSVCLLYDYH